MSERELYWRGVRERQTRSGESVVEFCAAAGISTASFHSWRKRLLERQDRRSRAIDKRMPQLVPVSVAASAACVETVLPDGIVLRVPEGDQPRQLLVGMGTGLLFAKTVPLGVVVKAISIEK